jgi:hypothetical protein
VSGDRTIANDKLERWSGVFKVLFRHLLGGTDGNYVAPEAATFCTVGRRQSNSGK